MPEQIQQEANTSPLGQDVPAAAPAKDSTVVVPAKPPETLAKRSVTITQEEFDQLTEVASNYSAIIQQPQLVDSISDFFKAKTGRANPPKEPVTTPTDNAQKPDSGLDDMKRAFQNQQQQIAGLTVALFKKDHPDMDDYKTGMSKLLTQHPGMSLDDAYKFAKMDKPSSTQTSAKETPTAPSTETKSVEGSDTDADAVQQAQKRINDPKATPSFDDAIDLAFQTAKQVHAKS